MGIVITCLVCTTVLLSILRITEKGIPIRITHDIVEPTVTPVPEGTPDVDKTTLDNVLTEIYDAFDISVETKEDRQNG